MAWQVTAPDFLVNTTTAGNQNFSPAPPEFAVHSLANGRFVVTWDDDGQTGGDTSGQAVRGQVFNADGTRVGAEFLVNTTTSGDQSDSAVTSLAGGGFVVSWTDASQTGGDTSSSAVRAQTFDANGIAVGGEFLANATTTGAQANSAQTLLQNGNFVTVWDDASQSGGDASDSAIRGRIFTASGSPSGAEFLINTTTADSQTDPAITTLPDGRFIVTWSERSVVATGGARLGSSINGQIFNEDGSPSGSELTLAHSGTAIINGSTTVNTSIGYSSVALLAQGGFVVSWSSGYAHPVRGGGQAWVPAEAHAQIFDASGQSVGGDITLTTWMGAVSPGVPPAQVIALADGRFVASWSDGVTSHAQIYAADGTHSGEQFVVPGLVTAALSDGHFVTTWAASGDGDPSGEGVHAQIYDATHYDGSSNAETVIGGTFADTMFGNGGDDTLHGAGGGDTLYGGDGNDMLDGGAGADALVGGDGFDFVSYQSATAGVSVDLAFHTYNSGDAAGDTYSGIEAIVGSEFADGLFGSDAVDVMYGASGNDTIYGRGGNDVLLGNSGNDTLDGGAGADSLDGGSGFDFASYQSATQGVSADLEYTQYNSGDAAGDTFTGIEAVVGSEFNDGLFGTEGNDVIYGGAGNDTIYGRGGNDALLGTGGNDILVGGAGDDMLYGDQGSGVDHDVFVFEAGDFGHDIIQGFGANDGANHDVIQMDHAHFANFNDLMAHTAQLGTDVYISDGTSSIQLVAVNIAALTADDFMFV